MSVKNDDSIDDFMKTILKNLTASVKSSFDLPTRGTSEDSIFNEFPQYKKVVNGLSLKILNNIQSLIDKQDGKGNILDTGEKKALEDKFNILVEVNDRLLDKCNNLIASIENPENNKASSVVMVEYSAERDKSLQDGVKLTPRQTIQLLSSKQIERPQLKFAKQPDNSKAPFRPSISKKPNAKEPLNSSIDGEDDLYPHPYGYEIDLLQISDEYRHVNENLVIPGNLEETAYEYIDTIKGLMSMIADLKKVNEIAVDLEHHNVRTYLGLTCLLQISTRTNDYIVDTLALHGSLEVLNEVFTDPKIVKVFHGANNDVMWLQRDLGVYVVNMFDTGQACTSLNFPHKSLSYLLEHYCQIRANKEFQRLTDWRIRPLIPELIEYARTDTHFLLYIYDRLKVELNAANLIEEVFDASKKLCLMLYQKPSVGEQDCMDLYLKSNEQFNPRQLYALKRLWELRDNIAREEDESPPFVLPNRLLLSIAQVLPRETSGVLACCSQDWKLPLLRKYVYDFQKICLEAYSESLSKECKKKVARTNVLEFLLCKHDRTVTNEVEVTVDKADVEAMMKEPELSFPKRKGSSTVTLTGQEEEVVKMFLAYHPVEVTCKESIDELEEVPTKEMEVDEVAMDKLVETVILDLTAEEEESPTKDIEMVSDSQPELLRPARAPKKLPTNSSTTFDYEASMKQLKEESSAAAKGSKSFNPMATKKFKKNNRGKK